MADDPIAARRRSGKDAPEPTAADDTEPTSDTEADLAFDEPSVDEPSVDEPRSGTEHGTELEAEPDSDTEPELAADEPDATQAVAADAVPAVDASDVTDQGIPPNEPGLAATDAPLDTWTADPVGAQTVADDPTTLWSSATSEASMALPWLQARSPDDRICPFLRAVADDDSLGFAVERPDPANRCASMREAVPQSLRQQELVCLTTTHLNCPRYVRGAVVASEVSSPRVRPKVVLTPAVSASLIILALSFGASVVFGIANGGLTMPSMAPGSGPAASAVAAVPSASNQPGSGAASATPSTAPGASASMPPASSPSVSPKPSKTTASPRGGAAAATPAATSPRTKLLKPCPDKPNCWIYKIRSGDNLFSIAKYFGVSLKQVKALNPWTRTQSLRAGQKLILPNPTR